MTALTENIKTKRKEKGLTQREMADALGISDKTVSRWESGVQVPDAMILPDVARILDTTVSALYGESGGEEETAPSAPINQTAPPLINKKRIAIFKIVTVIGLTVTVMVTILLCNLDILRGLLDPHNEWIRSIYFDILGGAAIVLIINKMLFMLYYQKKEKFQPVYLKTDISYSAPAAVIFCAVILLILPFTISVHFTLWYAAVVFLICISCIFIMTAMKRDLRKAGVRVGRAVSVVSLILTGITVLGFFGAVFVMYLTFPSYDILVTEEGIYTTAEETQSIVSFIRNTDCLHYSYYLFLIGSLPLLGALLMNMIELMIKKEQL